MRQVQGVGRPRAVSREILEEAACELFLEKGYDATSVADITQRAGVSRATFFNYIPTKSDLLWTSVDDALEELADDLAQAREAHGPTVPDDDVPDDGDAVPPDAVPADADDVPQVVPDAVAQAREVLLRLAAHLEPGSVALAFANAEPMGLADELEESAARRQRRAAVIIGAHLRRHGLDALVAEVRAAALAGAFLAALRAWSRAGAGLTPFPEVLGRALDALL